MVLRKEECCRHGAYRNTIDESTAFGSELDQTTLARSQPNLHEPPVTGQRGRGVPDEVAILCQEIVGV